MTLLNENQSLLPAALAAVDAAELALWPILDTPSESLASFGDRQRMEFDADTAFPLVYPVPPLEVQDLPHNASPAQIFHRA